MKRLFSILKNQNSTVWKPLFFLGATSAYVYKVHAYDTAPIALAFSSSSLSSD